MRDAKWSDYFLILLGFNILEPVKPVLFAGYVVAWGFGGAYQFLYYHPADFFLWPFLIFLVWKFYPRRSGTSLRKKMK